METIGYVLIFSLIGGLFSLAGGAALLSKKSLADNLARYATPFAAGGLLAAVFLDLLKEGFHNGGGDTLLLTTLIGIIIFFFAERFLHWFHHHHDEDEGHKRATTSLIIVGDTMHNILDGVAIAAAFLISVPTGIVTALAVAAHEVPQEIGDFALLLNKGMPRRKVLLVNIFSALATTAAAIITFQIGAADFFPTEVLLGLSAGFLLYIAMSDIIPTIHAQTSRKKLLNIQPVMLLLGVVIVGAAVTYAHQYIDHGDGHNHGAESQIIEDHHEHSDEVHEDEDSHHE